MRHKISKEGKIVISTVIDKFRFILEKVNTSYLSETTFAPRSSKHSNNMISNNSSKYDFASTEEVTAPTSSFTVSGKGGLLA